MSLALCSAQLKAIEHSEQIYLRMKQYIHQYAVSYLIFFLWKKKSLPNTAHDSFLLLLSN